MNALSFGSAGYRGQDFCSRSFTPAFDLSKNEDE